MALWNRRLSILAAALALAASGAHAQYLLSPPNNGGQLQIGSWLPLPADGTPFLGGRTPVNGGTMVPPPGPSVDGPGVTYWPPLQFHRNPASMGSIMQGLSTPRGGAIAVPAHVLTNRVGSLPRAAIGVGGLGRVLQIRTSIDYAWPNAGAVFAPGGGPGIPGTTVVFPGPGGGSIAYTAGTKSFGGAAQFAISPGPFAGSFQVPPGGPMGSKLPVASVWLNAFFQGPGSATKAVLVGVSNVAAQGQSVMGATFTTRFGPVPLAVRQFTGVGPIGTIPPSMSMGIGNAALTNMVTGTKGFPWTTGFISITAAGFGPPEIFFLSGRDDRVAGVGNISMVSGALSMRTFSGPNANRGWVSLSLPEPGPAIGSTIALAALWLFHAILRRPSAQTEGSPSLAEGAASGR